MNILLLGGFVAILLAGCSADSKTDTGGSPKGGQRHFGDADRPGVPKSRNLPTQKNNNKPITLFERIPETRSGINFVNPIINDHEMRRLYSSGFACGGIAAGDLNGDGMVDLFMTSGPRPNRLYFQAENLRFVEDTNAAGLATGNPWSSGASLADIDNDGDLDLFVCNYNSPNQLFINDGKGRFAESARTRGLDLVDASLMGYFCDYDLDGDLDLYVQGNRLYRAEGRPEKPPFQMVNGKPEILPKYSKFFGFEQVDEKMHKIVTIGRPDHLYRNDGKGFFKDVTQTAGFTGSNRGLSATWYDYDEDGWPDLFVANDMNDVDQFYRNNRNGTFTDVTLGIVPHTTWFSMGSDIADINNDGRVDYFCVDMAGTNHFLQKTTMGNMNDRQWFIENHKPTQYMWNTLFLNTGTHRLMEAAYMAGIANSDWSWAPKFADFDNDGWVDLFISNGMSRNFTHSDMPMDEKWLIGRTEFDIYRKAPLKKDRNLALRNDGNLHFSDKGKEWGLDHLGMSLSTVIADLDRDGNLDLVVANLEEPVHIYQNKSPGNRITLSLQGRNCNRNGIGARVELQTNVGKQVRVLNPYTGFLSSNEPILHFGLGEATKVNELTVHWPGGQSQTLRDLPANRHFVIQQEKQPAGPQQPPPAQPTPWFSMSRVKEFRHIETRFNDYERQPLLPYRHSRLGSGMATGDLNGDGREDLFFCGARNQPGMILFRRADGGFSPVSPQVLLDDQAHEDMSALMLDLDGDGDRDLLVTSGSVECEPGSPLLEDRLYLNDGSGNLQRAPAAYFPAKRQSSSIAAACDFDRDGDLDIFVGSRVIPGQYPLSPDSFLYINEKTRFSVAVKEVPKNFKKLGLVTSALWSDADGDDWTDLFVTTEWGPVRFFRNVQGKLLEQTKEAGLDKFLGWWNGIDGRDVDGDGDIDYAVTNFGLNTKYHLDKGRPIEAYYGKFDASGREHFVEATWEGDILYPVRGKSCSTNAMPHLKSRFKSFVDFAKATLPDIYTSTCLSDAKRFVANTLDSGILINDGKGSFSFSPMPRLAQISPGFGVQLTEVNGDGHADLFIVQNFFSNQHETGRMGGGLSLLLHGLGNGSFNTVWPRESGLILPGDSKALATSDFNADGRVDFIVTANNGHPVTCINHHAGTSFGLRLKGSPGNLEAIGARVEVYPEEGPRQVDEVRAGGSYLSQSSGSLFFSAGSSGILAKVIVRWPDGRVTEKSSLKPKALLEIGR